MGNEAAAGAAGGVFYVEHFVIEDVLDGNFGNGWMIHSSGQGVAVTPMTGWYRTQFAWGRRPLAEAGLTATR